MKDIKVADITIKHDGGTYLEEGSILPVYLDEENQLWACEHYDPTDEPCYHMLNDLKADGVVFTLAFTNTEVQP